MKKSTKIWLGVAGACILLGIVLTVTGRAFGAKNGVYFVNGKLKVVQGIKDYTSQEVTGIKNVNIDVSGMAIIVKESEDDKFYFNMSYQDADNEPEIDITDDQISVKQKPLPGGFWFNIPFDDVDNEYLYLYVPKNSDFKDFNLNTRNGRIVLETDLSTEKFNAVSNNGRIETKELKVSDKAYFKTTNGSITCNGAYAGKTEVLSSNGKITCKGSYSGDTTIDTSNGAVELNGTLKGDIRCESSNGSIDLTSVARLDQYNITARTSNGSVRVNDDKKDNNYSTNQKADNTIQLKTSNGSIRMYDNK